MTAMDLDAVVITPALVRRPFRAPDLHRENAVIIALADALAKSPGDIFKKVVEAVLQLCGAQSAGISLLDKDGKNFFWPAVAGAWKAYAGGGTPRDFGPCGTVLDRNAIVLFARPERHFTYLSDATPAIEEGLLAPFYVDGDAVGTLWAIAHDKRQKFDSEDARSLDNLSKFASTAYQTLSEVGAIERTWH